MALPLRLEKEGSGTSAYMLLVQATEIDCSSSNHTLTSPTSHITNTMFMQEREQFAVLLLMGFGKFRCYSLSSASGVARSFLMPGPNEAMELNFRGVWGHAPPGKVWNMWLRRCLLVQSDGKIIFSRN